MLLKKILHFEVLRVAPQKKAQKKTLGVAAAGALFFLRTTEKDAGAQKKKNYVDTVPNRPNIG